MKAFIVKLVTGDHRVVYLIVKFANQVAASNEINNIQLEIALWSIRHWWFYVQKNISSELCSQRAGQVALLKVVINDLLEAKLESFVCEVQNIAGRTYFDSIHLRAWNVLSKKPSTE